MVTSEEMEEAAALTALPARADDLNKAHKDVKGTQRRLKRPKPRATRGGRPWTAKQRLRWTNCTWAPPCGSATPSQPRRTPRTAMDIHSMTLNY